MSSNPDKVEISGFFGLVMDKAITVLCVIVSFCALSVAGTVLVGSDDYLDVELSMMFYYNVINDVFYKYDVDSIYSDVLNVDVTKLDAYIDQKVSKLQKVIKNNRIKSENLKLKETPELQNAEISRISETEMEYEYFIHEYTNNQRVRHGLEPLYLDDDISNVARFHSQDMLSRDFFDHNNLDGQTPTDRGNILGVSCVKNYISHYTQGLGENIFYLEGYRVDDVMENSKIIVDGWMDSLGHRENILGRDYDQIGIGVKFSDFKIYATQNFC